MVFPISKTKQKYEKKPELKKILEWATQGPFNERSLGISLLGGV